MAPRTKSDGSNKFLSVTSKKEGFRRGGRAWSGTAETVDPGDFTAAQLKQIQNEPMLIVHEVDPPKEAEVETKE